MGAVRSDHVERGDRPVVVTSPAPRRFRLNDWLALGLDALAEQGPAGLTIEALCNRAGKTKGSFYAHFSAIEAYLAALAGHWRETYTLRLMQEANKDETAQDRLIALDRMALSLDFHVEQGMRRLAQLDPGVAATCAEVDRERIGYLEKLHGESGRFTREEALAMARVEYAAYIGFQQLDLGLSPQELHDCYGTVMRLLVRPKDG